MNIGVRMQNQIAQSLIQKNVAKNFAVDVKVLFATSYEYYKELFVDTTIPV